jgi:hypothetical protein
VDHDQESGEPPATTQRRFSGRIVAATGAAAVAAVLFGFLASAVHHDASRSRSAVGVTATAQDRWTTVAGLSCPQDSSGSWPSVSALSAFRPVSAVMCAQRSRDYPGAGQWLIMVHFATAGDLRRLQAAFEVPDARIGGANCTDDLVTAPKVILVDARGRTIRLKAPIDSCGKPIREVWKAVQALAWTEVAADKIRPLAAPAT